MREPLRPGVCMRKPLMKLSNLALTSILSLALASPLAAEQGWIVQGSLGGAASLRTSLSIRQTGFETIRVRSADYDTKAFTDPVYYSIRAGRWTGRGGWELELIHHKLYLQNGPPEVVGLEISHGYNLVTVNRGWDLGPLLLRVGAGPVVAHVEGKVRGRSLDTGGYHWTGPVVQVGAEKRFPVGERWRLGVEGKISAARAVIPVNGGELDAPNVAGHLLVSFGYRWGRGGT
jgi:hypothetical protein